VLSRRGSQLQFETVRDALVVTGCAALLIWGIVVAGRTSLAAKPNPNGAYKVIVGGDAGGTGSGKAVVNAKTVKIDATLDDGHGNVLVLSASKLPIDSSTYRFSGVGTVNASIVKVSGRIDPPDPNADPKGRTLKNWRIVATFATTDGKCAGRVIGQQ
jgi:hypothetical protein